jgi:hypothetical protein
MYKNRKSQNRGQVEELWKEIQLRCINFHSHERISLKNKEINPSSRKTIFETARRMHCG